MVCGKKDCPRERNLREIYTENNVGTEFSRYDAMVLEGAEAEYEQIRGGGGGATFSWAQGHKVSKYGPVYSFPHTHYEGI
jgi:hypothetical protein